MPYKAHIWEVGVLFTPPPYRRFARPHGEDYRRGEVNNVTRLLTPRGVGGLIQDLF